MAVTSILGHHSPQYFGVFLCGACFIKDSYYFKLICWDFVNACRVPSVEPQPLATT